MYTTALTQNNSSSKSALDVGSLSEILAAISKYRIQDLDSQTTIITSKHDAISATYLVKDMEIPEEEHDNISTILETLSLHQELNSKYLLTLLHHDIIVGKEEGAKCKAISIQAVYEYGTLSLKQEIQTRIHSHTNFEEEELWAILATIVKALGHLQERGIIYGVLGTDKIFINDNMVKILDPSATATDPLMISEGRLYSPQILNDEQDIDMFKSDIYTTGLILLECGLLVDLSKQVEPDLTQYLELFSSAYSKDLQNVVESMLEISPHNRPSFEDLKDFLVRELQMNCTGAGEEKESNSVLPVLPDSEDMGSCRWNGGMQGEECEVMDFLYENYEDEEDADFQEDSYDEQGEVESSPDSCSRDRNRSRRNPQPITMKKNPKKSHDKNRIISQLQRAKQKYLSKQEQKERPSSILVLKEKQNVLGHTNLSKKYNMSTEHNSASRSRSRNSHCQQLDNEENSYEQECGKENMERNYRQARNVNSFNYLGYHSEENMEMGININMKKTMKKENKGHRNYISSQRTPQHQSVPFTNSMHAQEFHSQHRSSPQDSIKDSRRKTKQIKERLVRNMEQQGKQQSIQEEVGEESENSQRLSNGASSGRKSLKWNEKQIFTDPQLMRIIQEDLARISTTKNINEEGSKNKWFK